MVSFSSKKPFINFFKLARPFFSLTLLACFGLKFFGEGYIVVGGDWILMNPFSIIQNIGLSV